MFTSTQAQVVGVGAAISVMLNSFAVGLTSGAWKSIVSFLVSVAVAIFYIFDVDCTVVGDCSIWAWIKSAIILIGILISVILSIFVIAKSRKNDKPKEKEATKTTDAANATA